MAGKGGKTLFLTRSALAALACFCLGAVLFTARPVFAAGASDLTIIVSVNAPPPTASVTYPTEGLSLSIDTFDITGVASASNGVVSGVQVRIDGGAWQNAVNTGTNYSTWKYTAASLAGGSHTVECRADDQYGGAGAPLPPVTFTIETGDSSPPSDIAMVNDGTGADIAFSTSTTQLSANWTASTDPESGIARYWYAIGTTSGTADVLGWTDNGAATSVTKTVLSLTNGTKYYVSVKAENGGGLFSGITSSNGQTVDASPPISTVTAPANGSYLKQVGTITGTATDGTGSGLVKVEISIRCAADNMYWTGTGWQVAVKWIAVTAGTGAWSFSAPMPPWESGNQYVVKSRATDLAGNTETPGAGNTFLHDTQAPPVAITSPATGYISDLSPIEITGTVEAGSTVQVNGVAAVVAENQFTASANLTEGSNTITATALDAAGNTASASITVILDTLPPSVSIATPAQDEDIAGVTTITGVAGDANFLEYALYYGPGESPPAWGVITATSTTPIASGTLGTWDATRLCGRYTILAVARDKAGHATELRRLVDVANIMAVSGTLPLDQWTMIAMPGAPLDPDPRSFLGNSGYLLQRWDPTMPSEDPWMFKYREIFAATAGDAFWVKPYTQPINYSASAWVTDTTVNFEKRLEAGWNQIGAPYDRPVAWGSFSFRRDGDPAATPMSAAVANGWINSNIYSYSQDGYTAHDVNSPLEPNEGYFVKANVSGALVLDPGAEMPRGVARIVRPVYEWRVRIAARTDAARDTDNFAGEMRGASDDFAAEDSEKPPTVEPYVSVFFTREQEAGRPVARYAEDIRAPQGPADTGKGKTWPFVVKTSGPGENVTLTWPDADALPSNYDYIIRDVSTGGEIDPRALETYSFTTGADGTRSFELAARKTGETEPVALKTTLPAGWSLFSVPLEPAPAETDVRVQLGRKLDDLSVYQYYDNRLFDPDSPERVDIQAGIGYWAHADQPTEVEFKGAVVPPGTPVDVPLLKGWNFIGDPFTIELKFGDNITYICEGEPVTLSEAAARGWVGNQLYRFDNETGKYKPVEFGDFLIPWEGYVFRAFEPCVLQMK